MLQRATKRHPERALAQEKKKERQNSFFPHTEIFSIAIFHLLGKHARTHARTPSPVKSFSFTLRERWSQIEFPGVSLLFTEASGMFFREFLRQALGALRWLFFGMENGVLAKTDGSCRPVWWCFYLKASTFFFFRMF